MHHHQLPTPLMTLMLLTGMMFPLSSADTAPERHWHLVFNGFFGLQAPLTVYARERDNRWVAAMGSSIRPPNKYGFNKSYYWVDMDKAPVTTGLVKGPIRIHLTPDNWVPSRHLGFTVDMTLDATINSEGNLEGTYQVVQVNSDDPTGKQLGAGGKVTGFPKPFSPKELPDPITFTLNLQGALVCKQSDYKERCIIAQLGFQGHALKTGIHGRNSLRSEMYGATGFTV